MRFLAVIVVFGLGLANSFAETPRKIGWKDLASGISAMDNPYYGLSSDEARLIGVLVETAELRKANKELSIRVLEGEKIALAALDSIGIDGRTKVNEVALFSEKLKTSRAELNKHLLDNIIEIPGYVLPLEFDGMMVTEFILVPYAGACIHTPPPPANQMIIVHAPDGFKLRGMFDPVVVSGKLSRGGVNRSVGLSDGQAEFDVGYKLDASLVRAY